MRSWSIYLTPEQNAACRRVIDEYETNVAGMWALGRWNGWRIYHMPTTSTPTYIEMRKYWRDRIIYRKEVPTETTETTERRMDA